MLGKYNVINTTCGISEGLQPTCMAHGRYTTCEVEKTTLRRAQLMGRGLAMAGQSQMCCGVLFAVERNS
jgi:hypothetical protein